jgi:hypothetical protein
VAIQFTDITSLQVLLAPEQGAEIHATVLTELALIKADGASLYSSQYSFTCEDIAQAMNACWLANPKGVGIFDASCYHDDRLDKTCVGIATAGIAAARWAVGSMPGNEIVHDKLYCSPELGLVFTGSYNLSSSASKEANNALFITSKSMAAFFAAEIEKNLVIVRANPGLSVATPEKPSY